MINADPDYIKAQKSFAIGSPFWTAGTAISGALAGLAGGNTSQMLAGGLAPYLALAVKKATTDEKNNVNMPANIAGHALAGAVVAYLQGGSVAGGAAGAGGGELAALYPNSTVDSLTSEQKANISVLSTLAGALAGGVAGNSSNAIGSGAVAGKVAVENNLLGGTEDTQTKFVQEHGKDVLSCSTDPDSESCHRGEAVNKAIAVALGAGAAGGTAIAVTPEIISIAQAAMGACNSNPVQCVNEVAIWAAEMSMGDALPVGFGVMATGKLPKSN